MRKSAVALGVVLLLALTACSSGPRPAAILPTDAPTDQLTEAELWEASPAFGECVALYEGVPEWTAKNTAGVAEADLCRSLAKSHPAAELEGAYSDPAVVEQYRLEMLAEVDPIEPHMVLRFVGEGEASVTWLSDDGMTQRRVTLPYKVKIDGDTVSSANVVQVLTEAGVGCKITFFSNDFREGTVVARTPAVEGQTLASCNVSWDDE